MHVPPAVPLIVEKSLHFLFQKMTLIYSLDFPLDDHGPTNPTPCVGYPSAGNS